MEFMVYTAAGAIADAKLYILIYPDAGWGGPYQYGQHGTGNELPRSDQAGYFVTKPVPPATLTVIGVDAYAQLGPHFQPCAVFVKSPSAAVTRIELIPEAAFDTDEALRPSNATEPSLIGTIFEMTPDGRKPVSGASIYATQDDTDLYFEVNGTVVASTRSSREGHFYFCGLPPDIRFFVARPGFVNAFVRPGALSAGVPLDIELRRLTP